LKSLGDRSMNGPRSASATLKCYRKMAHHQAKNPAKPSMLRAVFATVSCYEICPVVCFDEVKNFTIGTPSRWTLSNC